MQSTTGFVFTSADALWSSFQNKINDFVSGHTGISNIEDLQILRPDWQTVVDVIKWGEAISTLSKLCP